MGFVKNIFGKIAPLPGSFMMVSIVGFLVSAYLITDISWKFTMLLFFAVMFIASFISMTKAPVVEKKK
ncbi:hypothetical protein KY332_01015 [Candidatus Woesearchaeota archaeon]|nr:hypothetical protein [Candidatus Woesearchaeota archaeon]